MTSGEAPSPQATAAPMDAPTTGEEAPSTEEKAARKESPGIFPSWERISPIIREEKSPKAMALIASIK